MATFPKSVLQLFTRPRDFIQSLRTERLKSRGQSDLKRWSGLENIKPKWIERTAVMAEWVPPESRVLEFGAGRQLLRQCLPPGCAYTPSDLADRGDGTIVCDLNTTPLPPFENFDVAFFAGVFEYIHDFERLLRHLHRYFPMIIGSYCVTDQAPQDDLGYRRARCWVNDFSESELIRLLENGGYRIEASNYWRKQWLFRAVRQDSECS